MSAQEPISSKRLEQLRSAKAVAVKNFLQAKSFLEATPQIARALRSTARATATADPGLNIVGVGIGRKRVGGKLTARTCVRVYVQRKLPKRAMAAESMVPARLDGVETDVIETGAFRALALSAAIQQARSRLRPLKAGCSIGFAFPPPKDRFVMAGTLGAIVERGGVFYLLSNNHVLADEGQLAAGAPIYQPGLLDGGNAATDQVATLTQFVPLLAAGNTVDAALAQADGPALVSRKFVSGVTLKSVSPLDATVNLAVHKMGRTTGYTRGTIEDVSADVKVGYDTGEYTFSNQIIINGLAQQAFSDSGDSGSLIVARTSGRATGLLFAGSTSYTIANHIGAVLTALGVALVR